MKEAGEALLPKSRMQKAVLNTITSAIAEVVQLACTLILPRLILAHFGSAYNGITMSANQFLNAISVLIVGVTGSTKVALYGPLARGDQAQVSRVVKATERYIRKVGAALLIYVAVLTVFYPLLVDTGYGWLDVAPLIIAAGISAAGRYFFGITYGILLSADQSVYISNIFLSAANILNVIVSVVLIKYGASIQAVKLVSSLALTLNPFLRFLYVHRHYKLDRKAEPDNTALAMRRDTMAHSIANIVHENTDILVLTVFCDVKIVSIYGVYNLVMHALRRTQIVFTNGTEALFGNMWVKGEKDAIAKGLACYEFVMSAFASVAFSAALVMVLPFVSLYTSKITDAEYILPAFAVTITLAQMAYSFRAPYVTLVQGVGHYKQTKNGAYAEAIVNIVTSVVLVQFIGITGVAVGTLIANVFRTVQYALYIDGHLIQRGKLVFVKYIAWAALNTALICFAMKPLADRYAYAGWGPWAGIATVTVICGFIITLLSSAVFCRRDLKSVSRLALRILKKSHKKRD